MILCLVIRMIPPMSSTMATQPIEGGGAASLAARCVHLVRLALPGTRVGNAGLRAVADHCKALERLNVAYCAGVDGEGVRAEHPRLELRHVIRALEVEHEEPRKLCDQQAQGRWGPLGALLAVARFGDDARGFSKDAPA